MRVLFFGRHDPDYSRNFIPLKGLRAHGVHVQECRVPSSGILWPFRLLWRYLMLWPRFDVLFVSFPGQEVMLLARILTRKPIIFDAFTSHYEGYVQDRKKVRPGSIGARWYRWLDRSACVAATVCLTDTDAHGDFYAEEFGLPREKFRRVFVGADPDAFPANGSRSEPFKVHFHGHYIPLQGADVVVRAAALLNRHGVRVRMIGHGQMYDACRRLAAELDAANIDFIGNVPFTELVRSMEESHICLGIFGTTPKAQRVIPNKVYEALAAGRAVITADSPAARELLTDGRDALLIPAGDAQALADAILRLKNDSALRGRLAAAGHATLMANASPDIIGRQLRDIIETLVLRK